MKGDYQDDAPIMKFSPDAAGASSGIYQVQQYTQVPADSIEPGELNFSLVPVAESRGE